MTFVEFGRMDGGKNNRANRKRKEQTRNSVINSGMPVLDLHYDANGNRYKFSKKTASEILNEQIGRIQEFIWEQILTYPEVSIPFSIIHGEGNQMTLRDITIAICELKGFRVFSRLHRAFQGATTFEKAPLGEDQFIPDYYVEIGKDGKKKYHAKGNVYLSFIANNLKQSEKWEKESEWSDTEDRMFLTLRHVHRVSEKEWERNSDINGRPLKLGDLVQIHPQVFETHILEDEDNKELHLLLTEEIKKHPSGKWIEQTQKYFEIRQKTDPFMIIHLLNDIEIEGRPDKISTAIVQYSLDLNCRMTIPTHALRHFTSPTTDGSILP